MKPILHLSINSVKIRQLQQQQKYIYKSDNMEVQT